MLPASGNAGTGVDGAAAGTMDALLEVPAPVLPRAVSPDGKRLPSKELAEVLADRKYNR